MKIKVLIVDDEKLERILIEKCFDWESNGFEVIGQAGNGEEALRFMEVTCPQLILTDINMPFMDGLNMTQEIVERKLPCKVVMITGYREFEYARQAIRLGVNDFILKPVQVEEMRDTLLKVKAEIEREYSQTRWMEEIVTRDGENQKIVFESFLQRLAEGRIPMEDAKKQLELYHLGSLLEHCFCCVIKLHMQTKGPMESAYDKNRQVVELIKRSGLISCEYVAFVHYQGISILLMAEHVEGAVENIHRQINETLKMEAAAGLSELHTGFDGIRASIVQAKEALDASVIKGHNACISYGEYQRIKNTGHNRTDIDWNDFIFSLENGVSAKLEEAIDQYTRLIGENKRIDLDYLKLMAMNVISRAMATLWKKGKDISELAGEDYVYDGINEIEDIKDMNRVLKEIIFKIAAYHNTLFVKKENRLIDKVLAYLEEHLYEKEVSLHTVAKAHFVNDSYLSRMFKQETGESMMEYIMRKRMEESIRLLNTTDLKAYEIAERIGIGDPHYFSICFKKHVGVTIKEYKNTK